MWLRRGPAKAANFSKVYAKKEVKRNNSKIFITF